MKLENWITIGVAIATITAMFTNTFVKAWLDKSSTQDVQAGENPNANHTKGDKWISFFADIRFAATLHSLNIVILLIRFFFIDRGLSPIPLTVFVFSLTYLTMFLPLQLRLNKVETILRGFIDLVDEAHKETVEDIRQLKTNQAISKRPRTPKNSD